MAECDAGSTLAKSASIESPSLRLRKTALRKLQSYLDFRKRILIVPVSGTISETNAFLTPHPLCSRQTPRTGRPVKRANLSELFGGGETASIQAGLGRRPPISVWSYPMYGGYNGYYYGSPFYYGGSFGFSPSWRDLDDARHHGTSF